MIKLFLLLLVSLQSCHDVKPLKHVFLDSLGNQFFEVSDRFVDQAVWSADGYYLRFLNRQEIANNYQKLVMVSYRKNTFLSYDLLTDKRSILYFFPADNSEQGYALLNLSSEEELDELAMRAHQGPGLACGNLQQLNLNTQIVTTPVSITAPVYSETVKVDKINDLANGNLADNIASTIATLEAQGTRYHSKTSGIAATGIIETAFKNANDSKLSVSYEQFSHTGTSQKSLVVRIAGQNDSDKTIIVGAHLDSINNSDLDNAPGADDDASGIAVMVEVLRTIAAAGAKFDRSIEFHAYAAEEIGLVGSQDLAQSYKNNNRVVPAMLQLDMTSYHADSNSDKIYLVENDTSTSLRRSLKNLMNTYLGGNFEEKSLKSGTSDHRSWTQAGFAAVFPFEDPHAFNPHIHTSGDTSAKAGNTKMAQRFAKLVTLFLAHHAGYQAAAEEYQSKTTALAAEKADLYFAILNEGDNDDVVNFGISAASDIEAVEVCKITAASDSHCAEDRLKLSKLGNQNDRNVFYSAHSLSVANPQKLRVYGYNADNQLIALRNVSASR